MIFLKVDNMLECNFLGQYCGTLDYKNIEIDQIIDGSQFYSADSTRCVLAYELDEYLPVKDIEIISKQQYFDLVELYKKDMLSSAELVETKEMAEINGLKLENQKLKSTLEVTKLALDDLILNGGK